MHWEEPCDLPDMKTSRVMVHSETFISVYDICRGFCPCRHLPGVASPRPFHGFLSVLVRVQPNERMWWRLMVRGRGCDKPLAPLLGKASELRVFLFFFFDLVWYSQRDFNELSGSNALSLIFSWFQMHWEVEIWGFSCKGELSALIQQEFTMLSCRLWSSSCALLWSTHGESPVSLLSVGWLLVLILRCCQWPEEWLPQEWLPQEWPQEWQEQHLLALCEPALVVVYVSVLTSGV